MMKLRSIVDSIVKNPLLFFERQAYICAISLVVTAVYKLPYLIAIFTPESTRIRSSLNNE